MSNYESISGRGLVMKKDIKALKSLLIAAHNKQIIGLKPKALKRNDLKKASSKTTLFPIFELYTNDKEMRICELGEIALNMENGEMRFFVNENNHAVDNAYSNSESFKTLMTFLDKLPSTGKKYGAKTYYASEYDEDDNGMRGPGHYRYYGSWA